MGFFPARGLIYAGQCVKRGGGSSALGRKSWKERYFELTEATFKYYTEEGGEEKGGCDCKNLVSVKTTEVDGNKFHFEVKMKGRVLHMYAPSAYERSKWVQSLMGVIEAQLGQG